MATKQSGVPGPPPAPRELAAALGRTNAHWTRLHDGLATVRLAH